LPHFYARAGNGVEAGGGESLVAGEEAVDGVVLFHIATFHLEIDDAALGPEVIVINPLNHGVIAGDDVPLLLPGCGDDFAETCIFCQPEFTQAMDNMSVPLEGFIDSRRKCLIHKPLHARMVPGVGGGGKRGA